MATPRPPRRAIPAAAAVLAAALPAGADIVRLRNGARLEGRVTEIPGAYLLETSNGQVQIRRDLVARIDGGPTARDLFLAQRHLLAPNDTQGLFELGLWCRRNGLYREGAEVFRDLLKTDPDHAGARAELGYRRVGEAWIRGVPKPLESDHFLIEHGIPDEAAREARETLEAFHAAFSRAFCPPLRFHALHKIRVVLFARREEFLEHVQETHPQLAGRADALLRFPRAFTEIPSGRILAYLEEGEPLRLLRTVLLHEATHALLAMTREPQHRAPAWLEEAVADTLACSAIEGGEVRLAQGVSDHPLFAVRMAEARLDVLAGTALPLRDLFALPRFDFNDPRSGARYAQAVSVLQSLLRVEGERRPQAFREYLAAAQKGQGGVDDLERIYAASVEAIETRWRAFLLASRPPGDGGN